MQNNEKRLHEGHRSRIRHRYITEGGIDSFEDHEILELLLFYSYHTRMNTNEAAHRILNAFGGSLTDVFKASPRELMNRCGLSEKVAVQLSLISDLAEYYVKETRAEYINFDDPAAVQKFVRSRFVDIKDNTEEFHIICLGLKRSKKVFITDLEIGRGRADTVEFTMKDVVAQVLATNAGFVILAHNHPTGSSKPSNPDLETTLNIKNYLEPMEIKVLDHIIVAKDECFSFASHKLCGLQYKELY